METKTTIQNHIQFLVVIVLLVANLFVTSIILSKSISQIRCPVKPKSLPCESMPLGWVADNYECANSLLLAMNVTSVKILPKNSTNILIQKARERFKNLSPE